MRPPELLFALTVRPDSLVMILFVNTIILIRFYDLARRSGAAWWLSLLACVGVYTVLLLVGLFATYCLGDGLVRHLLFSVF